MMNINLHIENLIVDGLDLSEGQRADFQTALTTELSALLSNGGLHPGLTTDIAIRAISSGMIFLTADKSPTGLGQQIARAVYGGIGR